MPTRNLDDASRELLRSLAGLPVRAVHAGRHRARTHVVLIQRDEHGRIIGTLERFEETEFADIDGMWTD